MYTQRSIEINSFIYKLAEKFGVNVLEFNRLTLKLKTQVSLLSSVKRNFFLASVWAILAFGLVFKYWFYRDRDRCFVTLAWWCGYMVIFVGNSIITFHTQGIKDTANGLTDLLSLVERKQNVNVIL